MAAEKTKRAKGFGARYGKKVREKIQAVNDVRKATKKCPYCHALKLQRVASGIWNCKKCLSKFTGRAYSLAETNLKESEDGRV